MYTEIHLCDVKQSCDSKTDSVDDNLSTARKDLK